MALSGTQTYSIMKRLEAFVRNRYTVAYSAAILLHVLLLWMSAPLREALLGTVGAHAREPALSPVAFEFVEAPHQPAEDRPPESARLIADRHSTARDASSSAFRDSDLPYLEGITRSREAYETVAGRERTRPDVSSSEPAEDGPQTPALWAASLRQRPGGRVYTAEQRRSAVYGEPSVPPSALRMDSRESSALEAGGLQLSTYAWDYAPYLAYLKRRIEQHISPPSAFTDFGLIGGRTRLRFRILPDGTMEALQVLGYDGSPLLRDTSTRAVEMSAPLRPLPGDFPDAFLEITGVFDYVILTKAGSDER